MRRWSAVLATLAGLGAGVVGGALIGAGVGSLVVGSSGLASLRVLFVGVFVAAAGGTLGAASGFWLVLRGSGRHTWPGTGIVAVIIGPGVVAALVLAARTQTLGPLWLIPAAGLAAPLVAGVFHPR